MIDEKEYLRMQLAVIVADEIHTKLTEALAAAKECWRVTNLELMEQEKATTRALREVAQRCEERNAAEAQVRELQDYLALADTQREDLAVQVMGRVTAQAFYDEVAARKAAEARVRELEAQLGAALTAQVAAEDRVRELEEAWNNARAACLRAESRLAAATAVIRRFTTASDSPGEYSATYDAGVAFLRNRPAAPDIRCYACGSDEPMATHRCQPAAPRCWYHADSMVCSECQPAAPTRLEPAPGFDAEHSAQIRERMGRPAAPPRTEAEQAGARLSAQLARRGLK